MTAQLFAALVAFRYSHTFSSKVDILSQGVADAVLVLCLPVSEGCRKWSKYFEV